MILKSKTSNVVGAAKRLAPLTASLLALCVIAACARTNGGKASIAKETPEANIEKALQVTGNGDFSGQKFLPENMAVAAKIAGAEITKAGGRGEDKGIDIEVGLVMSDLEDEIIAQGRANKVGAELVYDHSKEAVPKYLLSASCGDDHCQQIAVTVIEQAEEAVAMTAPAAINGVDAAPAADTTTTTGAPIDDAVAPAVLPATTPVSEKRIVTKGKALLIFGMKKLETGAKETAEEKTTRQNSYELIWKSPVDTSAMIKQHYNDLKEGRLLKKGMSQAQIDTERTAADAKAKADADKAAADKGDEAGDESGDDKAVTGEAPKAPAVKPAATKPATTTTTTTIPAATKPATAAAPKAVVVSPAKPLPVSTSAPVTKAVAKPVATTAAPVATVAKPAATAAKPAAAKPVAAAPATPVAKPVAAKPAAAALTTPVASTKPATAVTTTTTTTTTVAKPVAAPAKTVAAPAATVAAPAKTVAAPAPTTAAPAKPAAAAVTAPVASNAPAAAALTPAQKAEAARAAAKKTAVAAAAADYNAKLYAYRASAATLASAKDDKSKATAAAANQKTGAALKAATEALAKAKAA